MDMDPVNAAATNDAPVETPTNTAPAAGEAPKKTRRKRGAGAAGATLIACLSLEVARKTSEDRNVPLKKEEARYSAYEIKYADGRPSVFYSSNHRSAVATEAMKINGIEVSSVQGGVGRGRADPRETAEKFLASVSESERAAIFAKYMPTGTSAGAADLIADQPTQAPRNDTSDDFNDDKPTGATPNLSTGVVSAKAPAATVSAKPAAAAPKGAAKK